MLSLWDVFINCMFWLWKRQDTSISYYCCVRVQGSTTQCLQLASLRLFIVFFAELCMCNSRCSLNFDCSAPFHTTCVFGYAVAVHLARWSRALISGILILWEFVLHTGFKSMCAVLAEREKTSSFILVILTMCHGFCSFAWLVFSCAEKAFTNTTRTSEHAAFGELGGHERQLY